MHNRRELDRKKKKLITAMKFGVDEEERRLLAAPESQLRWRKMSASRRRPSPSALRCSRRLLEEHAQMCETLGFCPWRLILRSDSRCSPAGHILRSEIRSVVFICSSRKAPLNAAEYARLDAGVRAPRLRRTDSRALKRPSGAACAAFRRIVRQCY